ncbi:sulfite exporter TauE/SafE family protein [Mycobacterium sp. URHB0044]|uniref:sulfite exporter TauE/SafE family protein n=1 Tax=Mycobacterium sp. URHB0044 TaxID=1380386 RepID=UPI0004907F6F|nr:sulfite exporter TauE/SafE family protein [Mycobacterium sp. URHB0044]
MPIVDIFLIALAGVGAGAINAVVGSGTLITFPTLVALGYPPVTATMSNAVGLVAGGISGTWGYRRELRGQWHRLRWQIPASLVGAGVGAWLLLHLSEKVFTAVVPVLLIGALLLVVFGPRIQAWARRRAESDRLEHVPGSGSVGLSGDAEPVEHVSRGRMAALVVATFAVGIYGGYFTAAQGILLIGAMGALLPESMQRMNAAKNLLSLLVNVVAAVAYTVVAFDRISWIAAGLIAVGSLIGGFLGAHYGRRLSPNALRVVIVVVGLIGLYRLLML